MQESLFKNLDYKKHLLEHKIHKLLDVDLESYGDIKKKQIRSLYENVDTKRLKPFEVELDDLIRLHYLIISRKVTTILEMGIGKSTIIFDHALSVNKSKHLKYVTENLRRTNPFECHSIENNKDWIKTFNDEFTKLKNTKLHYCECEVGTFNSRICTYYNNIPNICPDFIYLDAPDQFSVKGNIRGLTTNHPDRMPMSADILSIEHFLAPGTFILIDGRAANARFLKSNFQRDWSYFYSVENDEHYFELKEEPLGIYNKRQVEFCHGKDWNI